MQTLAAWCEPLDMLRGCIKAGYEDVALLYSSLRTSYSGQYSYLAYGVTKVVSGDDYDALSSCHTLPDTILPHWFGTLNYELLHVSEDVAYTKPTILPTPLVRFCCYTHVLRFDHDNQEVCYETLGNHVIPTPFEETTASKIAVSYFDSTMSKQAYLGHVQDAIAQINAGNFYQANVTRKFHGTFEEIVSLPDAASLFATLSHLSPAPYSAFICHGGHYIISSSPELFIHLDQERTMTTRPIKGTASKVHSPQALQSSEKDRAENLMIVDLMRNDLTRCAAAKSVHVPQLFDVDSFATLHHLSSTVRATLAPSLQLQDMLKATFPPGSMTGAPKIAAMQWIAQKEAIDRGTYSGSIGWIRDESCEFSVVIRTLMVRGNQFEFQVGGGIVADSDPENEYQEIITKARALSSLLDISIEDMDA